MAFLTSSMRRALRRTWAGLGLLLIFGSATPVFAVAPTAEYQIKAVFLFNFAQFVEWPASAFSGPSSPLVIGILGDDPFGPYLDELLKDERVGARPLQVRRYQRIDEVDTCHVLYVSRSEHAQLDKIMAMLGRRAILTIGDDETFSRSGGMIRLVKDGGRIRLRINLESAKACGLTISSKIIRPATLVTTAKD